MITAHQPHVIPVDQQMHAYLLLVTDNGLPAFLTDKFDYLHRLCLFYNN